ncbi:MAG: RNA 2',3'-cyclic phosphodiesterase [Proteobacteria bacterium]|nr:RNA 2',3'-cyclic phosphodiesterase [Pseudomonadota bacterium]MBU4582421.1 RNA 2',3'-cyclic phosphodiesterase [Pseudomonadota bacterium]
MTAERTIRAFLALDPPEEILREIGRIQDRLRKLIHGELRWVRPEGIHLTLKFFGDVPENAVADISAVAGPAAAAVGSFELAIGGTGVFPDPRRPRVVWLGMNGDAERLVTFQQALERALREVGFPPEERPFRPHLTLGRIKSPKGLTGLTEALEKEKTYTAGLFTASVLSLFQSELTPRGAVYTRLAVYPFTGQEGA